MSYEECIAYLKNNHFYPMKVRKDLKTGGITGIEIDCASILKDSRVERIKEVLGDKWKVEWVGSDNDYILINKINENGKRIARRID